MYLGLLMGSEACIIVTWHQWSSGSMWGTAQVGVGVSFAIREPGLRAVYLITATYISRIIYCCLACTIIASV